MFVACNCHRIIYALQLAQKHLWQ